MKNKKSMKPILLSALALLLAAGAAFAAAAGQRSRQTLRAADPQGRFVVFFALL